MTHSIKMTGFELRKALILFRSINEDNEMYRNEYLNNRTFLIDHPFGFDLVHGSRFRTVILLGDPRSRLACRLMLYAIDNHFETKGIIENSITRLRIIFGQSFRTNINGVYHHDIYFELLTENGTYMVGGSSDYSDDGKLTFMTLERLFKLVALAWDVEIERVTIPEQEFTLAQEKLFQRYRDTASLRSTQVATAS